MLLTEVKKLKVAELRAGLTERGLDAKGLKAELIARLVSAIEAGVEPIKTGNEGTTCETPSPASETPAIKPLSLQREAQFPVCSGPSMRAYTDQSTQTEPQAQCSCTAQQLSSVTPEVIIKDLQQHSILHPVVLATAAAEETDVVSGSPSSVFRVPGSDGTRDQEQVLQTQSDETETVKTSLQDSRLTKRHEEKGRDYYEFKEDIQYNRVRTAEQLLEAGDEAEMDVEDVRLDSYNCDLHFEVSSDGSCGQPLFWEKFPLIWSGCRMTHGFCQGKVGFEAKFVKRLSSPASDTSSDTDTHMLRVGWSVDNTSLQLGEVELSYGFDGRGKTVTGGEEAEFGEPFSEGDIIGCFASISEGGEVSLSFQKNGRSLGVAFQLSASLLRGQALFPHVLCKNCLVSVNLDPETPWHPFPSHFCTLSSLPPGQRTRALLPAASRRDCEVLMMVGMPGSGKTHWAQAHMIRNPRKRYILLSTNSVLDCMGVYKKEIGAFKESDSMCQHERSLLRQRPAGDQREKMLQQATQCVSQLIRRASSRRRNFIIDQANIYPSAQRHKMMCFHGYQRKAVVVFPADEVWKRRLVQHQEEEGTIPEISLLKAKASFTLPESGEHLDEVMFVELCFDEALKLLTQYKEKAQHLLPSPPKRKKPRAGNHKRPLHQFRCRGTYSCQSHNQCSLRKTHSYGCRSDPQRYRKYYRPCTGQWTWYDQSPIYYGSLNYGCST